VRYASAQSPLVTPLMSNILLNKTLAETLREQMPFVKNARHETKQNANSCIYEHKGSQFTAKGKE